MSALPVYFRHQLVPLSPGIIDLDAEIPDRALDAEAPTIEALRDQLPPLISDLIEESEPALRGQDIVVEIIAHTQTRVPAGA
jgi:hypothetical protein